jgi:hypothetical protein
MYDREHSKIGFWKTNCSELWERLQVSDAPPPVPPNSDGTNLTQAFEPSVAPSPSQYDLHQGIISCWYSISILKYIVI